MNTTSPKIRTDLCVMRPLLNYLRACLQNRARPRCESILVCTEARGRSIPRYVTDEQRRCRPKSPQPFSRPGFFCLLASSLARHVATAMLLTRLLARRQKPSRRGPVLFCKHALDFFLISKYNLGTRERTGARVCDGYLCPASSVSHSAVFTSVLCAKPFPADLLLARPF